MSVFGNFNDLSNQIIREGQEISVKLTPSASGDGTATISWNIPPPANGCSAENQAYDGIVITASESVPNYISTSPKNKVFYNADPTLNLTSNLGDKLDTAYVVAALYHDKKTNSITVTDFDPKKWYYVSAYAVDNVGTYHREGAHAFSLPTGQDEGTEEEYAAYQDIQLLPKDGSTSVGLNTSTGLDKNQTYSFVVNIDGTKYTINVDGINSLTYKDLIDSINRQFKLLGSDYFSSPSPPNAGKYYFDSTKNLLYKWDGYKNTLQNLIVFNQDPALKPQGSYWYNPVTDIISMYETGGWAPQKMIKLDHKPNQPECGELWFTGSEVYEWDGDHWVKLCLFVQTRNPQLSPVLNCNTYWFDKTSGMFYKWNVDTLAWTEETPIVSKKDPNTLGVGDIWYNETIGKMERFSAGQWNELSNVVYQESAPTYPIANQYWYNPETQELLKRSSDNTSWIEYEYVLYPSDPMERKSNDLWWNQSTSIDTLYVWDIVNTRWIPIDNFYQSETDPSLPPNLPTCVVWYNPSDGTLKYIIKSGCTDKEFIFSLTDPTNPSHGDIWFDTKNSLWYVWDGSDWSEIQPIISTFDPFDLHEGYFWYDPETKLLKEWNGSAWVLVQYSTSPLVPQIGTKWFDTVHNELFVWNGVAWVQADPIAKVSLNWFKSTDQQYNGRAFLRFEMADKGCCHYIEVIPDGSGLFTKIVQSVIYSDPVEGNNGVGLGTSYNRLGVGTDGSPDERRAVHDYIRQFLGFPVTQVELFKSQIDHAIDTALLLIRKYSGYGVNRNFFFLDLKPNQQIYQLTNKCVGFNKVVHVLEISRMRQGWLRTAFAGNDLFGVAALQQLYSVGTFDMLSFHLVSSYIKELEILFASRIVYQFNEKTRELRIFQNIIENERVLMDATIERTEQDLLTDRETSLWIKKWALAEAKGILGQSRSKYVNLAGPNGSTSLNGSDLAQQSIDEKEKLKEELLDPAMQNYNGIGASVDIVIG